LVAAAVEPLTAIMAIQLTVLLVGLAVAVLAVTILKM